MLDDSNQINQMNEKSIDDLNNQNSFLVAKLAIHESFALPLTSNDCKLTTKTMGAGIDTNAV